MHLRLRAIHTWHGDYRSAVTNAFIVCPGNMCVSIACVPLPTGRLTSLPPTDIIGNLGDESSLLDGIDDTPMELQEAAAGPAGRGVGGPSDSPADWPAVPVVKKEEPLPSPPPRPPAVPTPQQKPVVTPVRPVQPVRPVPAAALVQQTPVVIDGKTYVISGQVATPAGGAAGNGAPPGPDHQDGADTADAGEWREGRLTWLTADGDLRACRLTQSPATGVNH